MDVTKSSSSAKTLPFARLPHLHSYDPSRSRRQNHTNRNRNESASSHNDKNMADISSDNTDHGVSANGELDNKGHGSLSFNRTRLYQIENYLSQLNSKTMAQENISNGNDNIGDSYSTKSPPHDFFYEKPQGSTNVNDRDKADRMGREYFNPMRRKFGDSGNGVGLLNNNRQTLRTGRIMNNPESTHLSSLFSVPSNIGSQYVNLPFTVTPMYGNTFAQLKPYQSVKNIKSIGDVLKYITKHNPSNIYITSTGVPDTVGIKKAVKFTGTYTRPVEDESGNNFASRFGHKGHSGYSSSYSQSYGSFYDPFRNFRPVNPSEINRLISTGKNADSVPSSSDKIYFTEPSSMVSFASTTPRPLFEVDSNRSRYYTSGLHTIAVFKPLAPTTSYGLGFTAQPPAEITKKKAKPFSVTLDIYPMTVERDQVASGNSPQPSFQFAAPNKNRPPHARWKQRPVGPMRGPRIRKPNVQSHNVSGPENHMIVHLNVFPNRAKKQPRQGRGHEINKSVLNTVIAGGTFGHRSFDGHNPVEDYSDYDDINFSLESNTTSNPEINEFNVNAGNVSDTADVGLEKKVTYDLVVANDETQENISGEKENGNSDSYDDGQVIENSTTNIPDEETTESVH